MTATIPPASPSELRTTAPLIPRERVAKERGGMTVQTHPRPAPVVSPPSPELRVIEARRRAAKLHLLTYIIGNALFWTLWAAVSVSADPWYWSVMVPFAGWTLVLALHLWHAYRQ